MSEGLLGGEREEITFMEFNKRALMFYRVLAGKETERALQLFD